MNGNEAYRMYIIISLAAWLAGCTSVPAGLDFPVATNYSIASTPTLEDY